MDVSRIQAIREGSGGLSLVLYLDVPDELWEEYAEEIASVIALDEASSSKLLDALKGAMSSGHAQSILDRSAEAIRLLLATAPEYQAILASMLEGISGKRTHVSTKP